MLMRLRWMALFASVLAVPLVASATTGSIVPGYGTSGKVSLAAVSDNVGVGPLRVNPGGRTLVSYTGDPESGGVAVVDPSGSTVVDIALAGPGFADFDSNGSVYAAYTEGGRALVSRYDTTGALDLDFGSGGIADVDLAQALVTGVTADGDGVVVVGSGSGGAGPFGWAARFDESGQPDLDFGNAGVATLVSLTTAAADNVLIAGLQPTTEGYIAVALVRGQVGDSVHIVPVGPDGALTAARTLTFDDEIFSTESLLMSDGSVLVAVQTTSQDSDTFHLTRIAAAGALFTGFADPGLQADEVGGPVHLAQLRDGSLLVGYNVGPEPSFTVRHLSPTGAVLGNFEIDSAVKDVWIYGMATSANDGGLIVAVDETPVSSVEADDLTLVKLMADDSGRFIDDDLSVHESDISELAAAGITKGCNPPLNSLFCPDGLVTRGQMAAFLVRALSLEMSSVDAFSDDGGSAFEGDINALAAAGITKGCNPPLNSLFCPDGLVTRGQMAAFLVRALSLEMSSVDAFSDAGGSAFEGDINALAAAGITKGCNPPANSLFCPGDPVTRAQMASFLIRALGDG